MRKLLPLTGLTLALCGCAIQPKHPALQDAELAPLLPVRQFTANIDYLGDYKISPDGTRLAWRQVAGFREQIFVRSLGRNDTRQLGFNAQGTPFSWAQDSRRLLVVRDAGGDENFHLFVADTDKPDQPLRDLTPLPNTRVMIDRIIANDPANILLTHNHRDKTLFDLYRLNLDSGEQTLMHRNPGDVIRVITDRQGRLRGRIRQAGDDRTLQHIDSQGHWRDVLSWSQDDDFLPLGFTPDETGVWALSNRGRDKLALVRVALSNATEQLLFSDPDVDVNHVELSRKDASPALVYLEKAYPEVHGLQPRYRDIVATLKASAAQRLTMNSSDDEEQLVTFRQSSDKGTLHQLFDRRSGQLTELGKDPNLRVAAHLAPMQPIQLAARDGLTLRGYLTRPQGTHDRPIPMVLLVHGGPFVRDVWSYHRWVQFLANRGYAVLQINYRGSAGYGRAFMDAANGEFAGKMHDDLIDGVRWAIQQGIADPEKIAIMGRSYGGYATLVGLSMTPDIFACGVDIVGPSDLVSLSENFPPYWRPYLHRWRKAVGDPANPADRAAMQAKSPIHAADRVTAPLLVIQGANDVRVTQEQSDRMVAALRAAGKPVDYLLIKGEGHRIRHWKNRLKAFRATEDFLAACLGGRSSGFDYYQLGSWAF